jgi:quinolinate synthase
VEKSALWKDDMETRSNDKEITQKILEIKKTLGEELLILTHHYQRKEIVDLGDYRGDSFGLSQTAAADKAARFIVFCGVHFMAESAEILSQPHQTVQIPDLEAGCWMADMADIYIVENAWRELTSVTGEGSIMPVVYMNSDAALKAFCGHRGGAVCTSSNCPTAFGWAFGEREKILFFPDQHLGRNTGNLMGIPAEEMIVWNPHKPLGGNTKDSIKKARVILWDGYCLVHTRFRVEHVLKMRERFPEAKIVVHPECIQEVVDLADAVGSTSFIVKYVEKAPPNTTIIIGTEVNLVDRLAIENPDKKVLVLHHSLCPNMFKINLQNLLWSLENIGRVNVVTVPEEVKADARMALDRMLALLPKAPSAKKGDCLKTNPVLHAGFQT